MPGKRRLISNFSRSYFLLVNIIRLVLDIFFTDICFSIPVRNKFCFTGGIFEASVQLPGANNVVGMWPAIWTMGNLGRAGYGSTLEGMVRLSNNLPSPTIDRSGLIHPDNDNSGHIHMTPATSVQLQIKQSTGSPSRQCKMETIFTTMFCHIYLDRNCRDVLVTERTIPGQNMQTELMSGDLHRRSTCSRLRWVGNH